MENEVILLTYWPDAPPTAITFARETTIVGRDPACDIVVSDVLVSRRHAQFKIAESKLFVRDLSSKNGTFVDDERVDEREVRCGQRIRFAGVSFFVVATNGQEHAVDAPIETESADRDAFFVGEPPLSERLSDAQRRVFDLLLEGVSEKRIAWRLSISRHTVHNHVRQIYSALDVHSRPELLVRFLPDSRQ